MTQSLRPRLSTSSWSLHRALGLTYPDSPAQKNTGSAETYGRGNLTLLDVPAKLAAIGINTLEICHFHFPSRDAGYLNELRGALNSATRRGAPPSKYPACPRAPTSPIQVSPSET